MALDALSHIEKTLADNYRKEIDQEENVWRSLPFFAATIALQMAALGQFIARLPAAGTVWSKLALAGLGLAGALMATALVLLFECVRPKRFHYIASEPDWLAFAEALIAQTDAPSPALDSLKRALAEQYAVAAENNRRINKRREFFRARAGQAVVGSIGCTLFFVAIILTNAYVSKTHAQDQPHDRIIQIVIPS